MGPCFSNIMASMGEGAQEQDEGPPGCHLQRMNNLTRVGDTMDSEEEEQDEEDKEDTGLAHAGQVDAPDETDAEPAADFLAPAQDDAGSWCFPRSGSIGETASQDFDSSQHSEVSQVQSPPILPVQVVDSSPEYGQPEYYCPYHDVFFHPSDYNNQVPPPSMPLDAHIGFEDYLDAHPSSPGHALAGEDSEDSDDQPHCEEID